MDSSSFLFKVILIGNSGVGKTCLTRRFIQGEFPVNKGATIGVDFMIKPMTVNGIRVNLQLWDTAGQERFRAITQSYYRSAHCLVLVYDISSQPSFDSLSQWCREIENYTTSSLDGSTGGVLRILVGNKCDKEPEVPTAIGEQFARRYNFDMFMETSALQLDNVNNLFEEIAQRLVERRLANMSATELKNGTTLSISAGNGQNGSTGGTDNQGPISLVSMVPDAWRQRLDQAQNRCCSG